VKKCKIGYSLGQDNVNTVVRKKYESILEQMKLRSRGESREKYIDELFPPVEASIFNNSVHRKGIISKGKD
jgi:predicted ArsR family transcriptional regulator